MPNAPFDIHTISVEPARFGDIAEVARIQREAFRPGLAYSRFALTLLWLLPVTTFLVARNPATGEVLGNIITDRQHGNTRIINIAVAKDARRKGIGRRLLRSMDTFCPQGNVVLSVEVGNTIAQRLYEQEGYVRTAISRNFYGPGQHGYVMKRPRSAKSGTITAP